MTTNEGMIKAADLRGRPIVQQATGKRIARVIDLVVDENATRVLAVLVRESGWFSSAQIVRWHDIVEIGDVLAAQGDAPVVPTHEEPEVERVLNETNSFLTDVISTNGERIGIPRDLYFNAAGDVLGIEIQAGRKAQRYFLPREAVYSFGEDAIVVDAGQLRVV